MNILKLGAKTFRGLSKRCTAFVIYTVALIALSTSFTQAFANNFAYVVEAAFGVVQVIDTSTNMVVNGVAVGTGPSQIAITPNGNFAYVTNRFANTVSVIDTSTNTTVGAPITVGALPTGIAITPDGNFAYVANNGDGTVSVINTASNLVVGSPIAVGNQPTGIAITPNGNFAYVANTADNTVSVINTATNSLVGSPIVVGPEPSYIAITPNGNFAYVTNTENSTVSVIDTTNNTVVDTIFGLPCCGPAGIAITPNGNFAYVANSSTNTVSVIDTSSNTVVGSPIAVGNNPSGIAITPDGSFAYVTNTPDNSISVIDTSTNIVDAVIATGLAPIGIAITPSLPINKSFSPSSINPNATSTMTINLGNTTASALTLNADFSDTLPTNLSFVSIPPPSTTCGGTFNATANSVTLSSGASIPAGGCSISGTVTGSIPSEYQNNTSTLSVVGFASVGPATAVLTIGSAPTVSKSFNPSTINASDTSALTITLGNTNDSALILSANFSDTLPNNLSFVGTPSTTCGGTLGFSAPSSVTLFAGASIPPLVGCTITGTVTASTPSAYLNTTSTLSTLGFSPVAPATATLTVNAPGPVTVSKSFGPSTISLGDITTLTITLGNTTGSAQTLTADFSDTLPANLSFVGISPSTTCTGTLNSTSNSVTLPSGSSIPASGCTITGMVTATEPGSYTNTTSTLQAGGGTAGPAMATLIVNPPLSVSKSFSPSTINVDGISSMTITLSTTLGSDQTLTADFSDTLPANLSFVGTPTTTCTGVLNFTPPNTVTLPSGSAIPSPPGSCTITGMVQASAPGSYLNVTSLLQAGGSTVGPAAAILTVTPILITSAYSTMLVGPGPGSTAAVGEPIYDTASLSGANNPTGFITFTAFLNDLTCSSAPVFTSIVMVDGNGAYLSSLFSPSSPGNYNWVASYSGDANNPMVASDCGAPNELSDIVKATPTLITSANSAGLVGVPIFDTATLTGLTGATPGGSITFTAYLNDPTCSTTAFYTSNPISVNGNGNYTSAPGLIPGPLASSPTPDTYYWIATYSGDANNNTVHTACNAPSESTVVNLNVPSLRTSALSLATVGAPIFDTATLTGLVGTNPAGLITFTLYSNLLNCLNSTDGQINQVPVDGNGNYVSPAVIATSTGTFYWTVSYSGDTNNAPVSTSFCNAPNEESEIDPATPTLITSALSTGVVGEPIFDTATLAGGFNPGGTITFNLYSDAACTIPVGSPVFPATVNAHGNGTYLSPPFIPAIATTYYWTASYSGDINNNGVPVPPDACGADNEISVVIPTPPAPTPISLITSATPTGIVGWPIFDTATLLNGNNPTGTITFKVYSNACSGEDLLTMNDGDRDPNCGGNLCFEHTAIVTGNGAYLSGFFIPDDLGHYFWTASYSGDANNSPVETLCGEANEESRVEARGKRSSHREEAPNDSSFGITPLPRVFPPPPIPPVAPVPATSPAPVPVNVPGNVLARTPADNAEVATPTATLGNSPGASINNPEANQKSSGCSLNVNKNGQNPGVFFFAFIMLFMWRARYFFSSSKTNS